MHSLKFPTLYHQQLKSHHRDQKNLISSIMHSSHTHFFRFVVVNRLLKLKIIVIQVGPSDETTFLGASNFNAILSLSGVYEQTIAVIPIHFHFPNVRTAAAAVPTLKFPSCSPSGTRQKWKNITFIKIRHFNLFKAAWNAKHPWKASVLFCRRFRLLLLWWCEA